MPRVRAPSIEDMRRAGDRVEETVLVALRDVATRVIKSLDLSQPESALDDLVNLRYEWEAAVDEVVLPALADAFWDGAHVVATPIPDEALTASALFRVPCVTNELADNYLGTRRNPLVGASDRTWELMREELVQGTRRGEGVEKLSQRLYGAAELSEAKAAVIARTEANGAANAGAIAQVRSTGLPARKEWVASSGLRTRASHRTADGQKVPLTEKFVVGGSYLDRPHDPSGPAHEVVNCRCSVAFEVDVAAPPQLVRPQDSETSLGELGRHPGGCSLNWQDDRSLMHGAPWMIETADEAPSFSEALRRQEYLEERYDSAEYHHWVETAHLWHAGQPEHVRDSVERALSGQPDYDGEMWLNAVAEAPITRVEAYRGTGWPAGAMSQLQIRRMFPTGGTVDLPATSFTTDRDLARAVADEQGADGVKLVVTLRRWARAVPLSNWAEDDAAFSQHELLTGGRFKVIYGPVVLEEDYVLVSLAQVGVYRP